MELIENIFRLFFKGTRLIGGIFFSLFLFFILYVEFNTSSSLVKYDGIPCQNKIFVLNQPMTKVIGGSSTMDEDYYQITKNILQDPNESYVTVKKTGYIYPKGSKFKVNGYYVAYESGPMSGLGGGPVPEYLIQSLENNDTLWISYFSFDTANCNISTSINDEHFDIHEHLADGNITKKTI